MVMGEGPALDRPLSSLEKVHLISGYALSRKDIRHEREKDPESFPVWCPLHVFLLVQG